MRLQGLQGPLVFLWFRFVDKESSVDLPQWVQGGLVALVLFVVGRSGPQRPTQIQHAPVPAAAGRMSQEKFSSWPGLVDRLQGQVGRMGHFTWATPGHVSLLL